MAIVPLYYENPSISAGKIPWLVSFVDDLPQTLTWFTKVPPKSISLLVLELGTRRLPSLKQAEIEKGMGALIWGSS